MNATVSEMEVIGYLVDNQFRCKDCTTYHVCKVYMINIRPYSQQCSQCKKVIVDGLKRSDGSNRPLNLFDLPIKIEGDTHEWIAHVNINAGPDQSHNIIDKINKVLAEANVDGYCDTVSRKDF